MKEEKEQPLKQQPWKKHWSPRKAEKAADLTYRFNDGEELLINGEVDSIIMPGLLDPDTLNFNFKKGDDLLSDGNHDCSAAMLDPDTLVSFNSKKGEDLLSDGDHNCIAATLDPDTLMGHEKGQPWKAHWRPKNPTGDMEVMIYASKGEELAIDGCAGQGMVVDPGSLTLTKEQPWKAHWSRKEASTPFAGLEYNVGHNERLADGNYRSS